MSWFDAAGLANIAKSALKEAQKTIDKALDIKEEQVSHVAPTNTPIDTNADDFFGNWGVTENINNVSESQGSAAKNLKMASSIWGSFTGSFFDQTKEHLLDSLEDPRDVNIEDFSQSKLVVESLEDKNIEENKEIAFVVDENIIADSVENSSNAQTQSSAVVKRREKPNNSLINRLSIISTESGKNSSDSVDILSCSTTECTTTPESDILSLGLSTSSSAQGTKPVSDSVEILGDSLTSPSSVEVLATDCTSSRRESQHTDDFLSPLESPWSDDKPSPSIEKISPESVEVIPEDQEENSVAEDTISYTSVSESTSATVLDSAFNVLHLKPQKMLKDTFNRSIDMSENVSELSSSPDNKMFTDAITRAPSRSTMHLPLTQVSNQVLIDTQPVSNSHQDITNILQKTNIIDIPQEEEILRSSGSETTLLDTSTDDGSQSDKTLIANENLMETSSDTSTTTEKSCNSTHLKNLLADAMVEKSPDHSLCVVLKASSESGSGKLNIAESISISQLEIIPRPNSPLSSESRSDLVKIGSDHTSCHTSCDELETTTSSDIEIISSPNGDSSSTQSRQSPAKQTLLLKTKSEDSTVDSLLHKMTIKKAKGHNRELSEASSISDDSHPTEIDRLLRRISEMTEILESRESKIIDMNRKNLELQEVNADLKRHLDSIVTKQLESADVSEVTEEYTQRLSALEKKFQQAIREKDTLRKQLDQAKIDAATRMSKGEIESTIAEKEEIINELRHEGEKLSQQQLKHSNIIKKLRAKEKENESTIKNLKESVDSLSAETDRLKKSLSAKDDVERSQIEAVHQLTNKNKKLENEVSKLKSQLDDLTQKYDTTKMSLEAAKKEVIDKQKASSELLAREQMLENLELQKRMTESQNEEIVNQLEDLRYKLEKSDEEYVKKEQKLRRENGELLRRLEEAEARCEELSQSVLEVSKPLVRQLESLQSTHSMKIASFEKMEHDLNIKLGELQSKLQTSTTVERSTREECVGLRSKMANLEGQLSTNTHEMEMLRMQVEQLKTEKQLHEQELKSQISSLNSELRKQKEIIEEKVQEIESLNQQLVMEKAAFESERKRLATLQDVSEKGDSQTVVERTSSSRSNSPTVSLGKVSVAESMGSSFWTPEEPFELNQAPLYTNMFEMQMLQSNLKQREGEVQQLQWELNRREQERALLNSEISTLLNKVEQLETLTSDYQVVKTELKQLQQQYDTLCQLYGEKVEENEELKLDLVDVKDMYKAQIDELLRQQRTSHK